MPDTTADPDLPRGIALAWGVAADPQRGPKREMSVERIVETAVELADAEGLGAVSMAAVASRLGYTPMSLYRYVSAKDDLVLLMQEEATGLPPDGLGGGDWRARLGALYRAQVQRYLEHPWVLEIPIHGSPATPNSASWMDAGLHALAETPLTAQERLAVILLFTGHARWAGTILAAYLRAEREEGTDAAALAQREDALFRQLISADEYPDLREAIDAGVFLDDSDPFAFGFARCLDGVAAYLDAAAAGRREPPPPRIADAESGDADIAADKSYREARKRVREAEKGVREADRQLREARRQARDVAREARERVAKHRDER